MQRLVSGPEESEESVGRLRAPRLCIIPSGALTQTGDERRGSSRKVYNGSDKFNGTETMKHGTRRVVARAFTCK